VRRWGFVPYGCAAVLVVLWCAGCNRSPYTSKERSAEARTASRMLTASENPLELRAFLYAMPKGADLHNHLVGAVYAETWIREGAEDQLCVDPASMAFVKPAGASCAKGDLQASRAYQDQHLYDELIDSFSMRAFVPFTGISGHDHFFDAFAKFGSVNPRHAGEWLDEVATRADAQNEQYLELMVTPDFTHTAAIAKEIGWRDDRSFSEFRDELLARGLRDDVAVARAFLDQAEALRRAREHCGEAQAASACRVEIRFLYQVLRDFPKEQVFAQTLLGFEAASADPRWVGINYVQPEDAEIAMSDYRLHMKIVGFLHGLYPKVHISLHAGELAPGLVPPDGLCCHIRLAVEDGHAERIGHGADVMYEDRPYDLLREMAAKHVMVEVNLTSNDVILGVEGEEEPLPIYRRFNVPVGLSTDDEGVSRIDMTHEFFRAVETYRFSYDQLKRMVRTSIEHIFLPGESLWRDADRFQHPVAECAGESLGGANPGPGCAAFLKDSEKAQQQWELERRFHAFEASH
jgi:adenosine deaminase